MNFAHYITDHFINELNLNENDEAVSRLKSIKNGIIIFFIVNTLTTLYAFYTLFNSYIIAVFASILFQFIFIMIYIVLFATVRKSEYLKSAVNKKQAIEDVVLNGVPYRAMGFELDGLGTQQNSIINLKVKKGYRNIFIRMILLLFLGVGPAFFFSNMLHHPFTKQKYQDARIAFIEKQIETSRLQKLKLQQTARNEFDSLINQRNILLFTIDSLKNHPDKNGYFLEDIAWYQSKLKLFNEINSNKIAQGLVKIQSDSLELLEKGRLLREHYSKTDFFILRFKVAFAYSPVAFILFFIVFLILLLLPFFKRYSMMIKEPELIDDALEAYYKKIVVDQYERLKTELKKTDLVMIIEDLLVNENVPPHKKDYLKKELALFLDPGLNYTDPAFRVNQIKDNRKFIEKGNLAKYIGKQ